MLYFLLFAKEKGRKKGRKKENGEQPGSFFQVRHALVAVPHWDFPNC
jgi:hypothetical protein